MSLLDAFPCKLTTFEGPLDYLLHLVQQGELVLADIPLHLLTEQFIATGREGEPPPLETGAEFVGIAATLMWLKSKLLLPRDPAAAVEEENFAEVRLEVLQQLVEYCHLKRAARLLTQREEEQAPCHYRGVSAPTESAGERTLGLEIGLEELARLFQQTLQRAASNRGTVQAERWTVASALTAMRRRLQTSASLPFATLFDAAMCRDEVIVTFLSLLELMKRGEIVLTADGICAAAGPGEVV